MNELQGRIIRSDGSVINTSDVLKEILYTGRDLSGCLIDNKDEADRFSIANKLCDTDLAEPVYSEQLTYSDIVWKEHWFTPESYTKIDLRDWCISRCNTDIERSRVHAEIDEFEKRTMIPAILHMIYCVDIWRKNNIVWGVGRGSSVSSFVLYLIGITRLNPLKYNLDLSEWLK